jgi:hypothetical protein
MTDARLRAAVAVVLVLAGSLTASAYLKFGTDTGQSTSLHWTRTPVRYFITDRGAPGILPSDLESALARAFATWADVATATISFERAGFTGSEPFDEDGVSVIGFESRPDLERTLGATTFTFDNRTGEIIEADIFFNSEFPWSVAPGGQVGRFDLESIAAHEIGHFLGLGHSAIGETEPRPGGGRRVLGSAAVMFPIAFSPGNIDDRTLRADDVAGVSDIYPSAGFRDETGSVAGTVTKGGRGVLGAHVIAFNLRTGSLVGGFTLTAGGEFSIAGLEPGPTVLRVEPLDDADVDSFLESAEGVDVDFRVTYAPELVVVPRGGSASRVNIVVLSK